MGCSITCWAQRPYSFDAKDYVSTDDKRAPQSAFSYDEKANTFTIKASGNNNIAFKMDKERADGKYMITKEHTYFVVEGSDLKANPATSSYIWWFNGANDNSQEPPKWHFTTDEGHTLAVWDIPANKVMSSNMNFSMPTITIGSNGGDFIHAMGLTSTKGSSTIHNVTYLEKYGLAALYPCTWEQLGYTAEALTKEIADKLDEGFNKAEQTLANGVSQTLSEALDEAKKTKADITATTYAPAYEALHKLENAMLTSKPTIAITMVEQIPGGMHFMQDKLHTYVLFYNDKVVRVLKSYKALADIDKLSMSVIRDYDATLPLNYNLQDDGDISVASPYVCVTAARKDGHLAAMRADGRTLIVERPDGTELVERKGVTDYDTYTLRTTFALDDDEPIFGLGQIQHGDLNQRGKNIHLEQDNMKVCIPFFQSVKGYGLFWDNYSPTDYTDDDQGTTLQSTGSEIDYYLLAGENSDDVTAQTRWLTGDAPLMPLWNFGLYQSKEQIGRAHV